MKKVREYLTEVKIQKELTKDVYLGALKNIKSNYKKSLKTSQSISENEINNLIDELRRQSGLLDCGKFLFGAGIVAGFLGVTSAVELSTMIESGALGFSISSIGFLYWLKCKECFNNIRKDLKSKIIEEFERNKLFSKYKGRQEDSHIYGDYQISKNTEDLLMDNFCENLINGD